MIGMGDPGPTLHAPATARNREPLLQVLREILPPAGLLLEIAAGTGEHAVFFARAFPKLAWLPSDPDPQARASIAAHGLSAGLANLREPLDLDVSEPAWEAQLPEAPAAILAVNLLHISPWSATEGLMRGAGTALPRGAPLVLYGPFRRANHPTAPSNEAFDEQLRARDPRWGLRLLEDVSDLAARHDLVHDCVVEMPANNLTIVFRHR